MNGAQRKTKLSRYEVTIDREVRHTIILEVEARNSEEAVDIANNMISNDDGYWREAETAQLSQTSRARVQR